MTGEIYLKNIIKNRKKILYIMSAVLLAVTHIFILLLIRDRMPYLLDSDMSSELVLGKLLSDEKGIMSKNWYYSTELRVLNTQLLYAFFFNFTDNWRHVRLLSDVVLHGCLSASVIYFCRKADFGKYSFAVAFCTVFALSASYFYILLMGCYYIPHFVIAFLTLALTYVFADTASKKKWIPVSVTAVLGFASGLGGLRQIVITYLPLVMAVSVLSVILIFREGSRKYLKSDYFKYILPSFAGLFASGAGFVVNAKVFAKIYHFKTWDSIRFTTIKYEQLRTVADDFLTTLGFVTGPLSLRTLCCNCACAVIVIMTVWSICVGLGRKSGRKMKLLTVFFLCDILVFTALYTVTDMVYTGRYNYPLLVFVFPLIAMAVHEADLGKFPQVTRQLLALTLVSAVAVRGGFLYSELKTADKQKTMVDVAAFIKDTDYKKGFASFWNSNVLTELTDGAVEMYSWGNSNSDGSGFANVGDVTDLYKWLQLTGHMEKAPEGKVFAVYRRNELDHCFWRDRLDDADIIFETVDFVVYGYDDFDKMDALCKDYSFDRDEDRWLQNGENRDGKRILHKGGKSYGPYMTFRKGKYNVTIKGEKLKNARFEAYCSGEKTNFVLTGMNVSDGLVTFSFETGGLYRRSEVLIENTSSSDVIITSIDIEFEQDSGSLQIAS